MNIHLVRYCKVTSSRVTAQRKLKRKKEIKYKNTLTIKYRILVIN